MLSNEAYEEIRFLMAYNSHRSGKYFKLIFWFIDHPDDQEHQNYHLKIEIGHNYSHLESTHCFEDFKKCIEWLKWFKQRLDRPKTNMLAQQIIKEEE